MFTRSMTPAKRILQLGFVTQDPKVGKELREFVQTRDSIDLELIESAVVTTQSKPKGIGIFVYDLDASQEPSLHEFDRFMRERPQEIPVIVLSPSLSDELVRWFLRLRVADWIKTPLSPGELIAACGRVISQISTPNHDVRCMTFMGASGGVRTTT